VSRKWTNAFEQKQTAAIEIALRLVPDATCERMVWHTKHQSDYWKWTVEREPELRVNVPIPEVTTDHSEPPPLQTMTIQI
jgi:hypothetical protein